MKDQKSFEVRVHGLPPAKKRELEDMLQKFAMDMSENGHAPTTHLGRLLAPSSGLQKSTSSLASNQIADSAYASASASGPGSSGLSNSDITRKQALKSARSRHQNIHSYLHDIPEGLLPKHPSAMTEKNKRKLVVTRLEQIFAGKGAAVGGHHHPLQQQEVSHLAAEAERSAGGTRAVHSEGLREARIMGQGDEDQKSKSKSKQTPTESLNQMKPATKVEEHDFIKEPTQDMDQRPTRPLDLDPQRAQVPADNLQYMRHLGFSPPYADSMRAPEDDHGWIYLNLLINMAQLHTISVTTDFVKKALTEHSSKFELSSDGRKVRWKGGKNVTNLSSDGDASPSIAASGMLSERGSPRKKVKLNNGGSTSSSGRLTSLRTVATDKQDNRLSYTPRFFHRDESEDSDDSSSDLDDPHESPFPPPAAGDSSAMTSSGMIARTVSTKQKRRDAAGPIIFYNNARFCTDLSGDTKTEETMLYNPFLYHQVTKQPVGAPADPESIGGLSETRGPLEKAHALPDAMELDDNPIPQALEVDFAIEQTPLPNRASSKAKVYTFEASGLGGVHPADNFAVNVESRHLRVQPVIKTSPGPGRKYNAKIASILKGSLPVKVAFRDEIVSTEKKNLPPSNLPPPSCYLTGGDSEEEDESDSGVEDDISFSGSLDRPVPPTAPQLIEDEYTSSEDESEEGDDEDYDEDDDDNDDASSDEGSLDLLAAARQLDPEAVRAKEREYDANMAELLAEEIPAGSSAATAGGGSGFASPVSGMDMEEYERAKRAYKEARAHAAGVKLQKARTGDSTATINPRDRQDYSNDSDNDEEDAMSTIES